MSLDILQLHLLSSIYIIYESRYTTATSIVLYLYYLWVYIYYICIYCPLSILSMSLDILQLHLLSSIYIIYESRYTTAIHLLSTIYIIYESRYTTATSIVHYLYYLWVPYQRIKMLWEFIICKTPLNSFQVHFSLTITVFHDKKFE